MRKNSPLSHNIFDDYINRVRLMQGDQYGRAGQELANRRWSMSGMDYPGGSMPIPGITEGSYSIPDVDGQGTWNTLNIPAGYIIAYQVSDGWIIANNNTLAPIRFIPSSKASESADVPGVVTIQDNMLSGNYLPSFSYYYDENYPIEFSPTTFDYTASRTWGLKNIATGQIYQQGTDNDHVSQTMDLNSDTYNCSIQSGWGNGGNGFAYVLRGNYNLPNAVWDYIYTYPNIITGSRIWSGSDNNSTHRKIYHTENTTNYNQNIVYNGIIIDSIPSSASIISNADYDNNPGGISTYTQTLRGLYSINTTFALKKIVKATSSLSTIENSIGVVLTSSSVMYDDKDFYQNNEPPYDSTLTEVITYSERYAMVKNGKPTVYIFNSGANPVNTILGHTSLCHLTVITLV